jgi:hypothetical protein
VCPMSGRPGNRPIEVPVIELLPLHMTVTGGNANSETMRILRHYMGRVRTASDRQRGRIDVQSTKE